jgi:drug/metabolite transporter (DMT)-like permease
MRKNESKAGAQLGLTDLGMLMAVVLWSLNFPMIKIALREFSPLGFNGVRLVFASGLLFLFLVLQKEKIVLPHRDWRLFLFLGLVGTTFYQLCFIHGLNWTTASNSAIIIAMAPAIIALVSTSFRHERLSWLTWWGIVISFAGLYLVITQQVGGFVWSLKYIKGDLLIFTANFLWAIYTVWAKPLLKRYSPLKFTAWTMTLGTIFFLPFAAKDISQLPQTRISLSSWGALAYSGIFALAICYVIWYSSVKRVGNSRTAIYDNLIPLFTILFAFLILEERLSLGQGMGAMIIIVGVIMTRLGRVEAQETE